MVKQKQTNADFESIDPYEFKAPYFVCMEHLARYLWAAYFLKRKRAKTVLDIACGPGYGCRELAREGLEATGFDYDADNIKTANEKYHVPGMTGYFRGDINAREYLGALDGRRLDAVVCFETLEHVSHPQRFLEDLCALIKKRGHLLLSVPDAKYEPVDAGGALRSGYHLHAFTEDAAEAMLVIAGFTVIGKMYQPDSAGLHRNENRAIRDSAETRASAECYYNKSPEAARFLSQVYAWPRMEKGESYSNIFICIK